MRSTLLMALVAGLMLGGCGAQKRLRVGACDAHRREAALVTRDVVVYGWRAASPSVTTFYACRRPAGEAMRVGVDELGSVYGSDATTGNLRAAGAYVAAESSTGEATLAVCARYSDSLRCPLAQYWLTVIDTRGRRRARIPVYAPLPVPALVPFPVTLALSPKGAVAWLQNSTVGAIVGTRLQLWATVLASRGGSSLAAAPAMIDAGSIDPASMRFEGLTLFWVRDQVQHRQKVR
jgi:hypothetical protein